MLILLDRHVTIRPVHIDVEDEKVVLLLIEFTRSNLTSFPCDGALLYGAIAHFLLHQLRIRFVNIISISLLLLLRRLLLLVGKIDLLYFLLSIDQDLQQISEDLYSFLNLTFHQVHYTFSEISV